MCLLTAYLLQGGVLSLNIFPRGLGLLPPLLCKPRDTFSHEVILSFYISLKDSFPLNRKKLGSICPSLMVGLLLTFRYVLHVRDHLEDEGLKT